MADDRGPSEGARHPGLEALARDSAGALRPVEMAFTGDRDGQPHLLRVRRVDAPQGKFAAWVERLTVNKRGDVANPRLVSGTVCYRDTPHDAANAARAAADWT